MGCDIHLVLERRHRDKWIAVDTFTGHHRARWALKKGEYNWSPPLASDRNYDRFAKLAGVRGDGPEPRGVPPDASETTQYMVERWGEDGHSHSWLPLAEAVKIWAETEFGDSEPTDSMGKHNRQYPTSYFFGVDIPEGSGESIDDYRLVFWFDN